MHSLSCILKRKIEIEYDNICISKTNGITNILKSTIFFAKYSTFTKESNLIDDFHVVLQCIIVKLQLLLNTCISRKSLKISVWSLKSGWLSTANEDMDKHCTYGPLSPIELHMVFMESDVMIWIIPILEKIQLTNSRQNHYQGDLREQRKQHHGLQVAII